MGEARGSKQLCQSNREYPPSNIRSDHRCGSADADAAQNKFGYDCYVILDIALFCYIL